jgi:CheY-like chemotaxis protein
MIISAYDSLEDIETSKKAGANIHVSKPINKRILS